MNPQLKTILTHVAGHRQAGVHTTVTAPPLEASVYARLADLEWSEACGMYLGRSLSIMPTQPDPRRVTEQEGNSHVGDLLPGGRGSLYVGTVLGSSEGDTWTNTVVAINGNSLILHHSKVRRTVATVTDVSNLVRLGRWSVIKY